MQEKFNKRLLIIAEVATIAHWLQFDLSAAGLQMLPHAQNNITITEIMQLLPDLILIELNLPLTKNYQLLQLIKKNRMLAHIPIIIYSAANPRSLRKSLSTIFQYSYINKQWPQTKIIKALSSLLPPQ